jgi:hypothetical protein
VIELLDDLAVTRRGIMSIVHSHSCDDPSLAFYAYQTYLDRHKPFGHQTKLLLDWCQIALEQNQSAYVLACGSVTKKTDEIIAYSYREEGCFVRKKVRWPSFILRRTIVFPPSLAVRMQHEENLFSQYSQLLSLPRTGSDKWSIYRFLSKFQELLPHLPMTLPLRSYDEFTTFLLDYHDVYLKPLRGTQGQSILHFRSQQQGVLCESEKQQTLLLRRNQRLLAHIARYIHAQEPKYLLQQTVPILNSKRGQRIDFRYFLQAISNDHIQCTAIIARLANQNAITTNLSTGSCAIGLDRLDTHFDGTSWQIVDRAIVKGQNIALRVFEVLRKKWPYIAEVGIDIGISPDGEIKIFEVNPVPGRKMLRQIDASLRIQSLRTVITYQMRRKTPCFSYGDIRRSPSGECFGIDTPF